MSPVGKQAAKPGGKKSAKPAAAAAAEGDDLGAPDDAADSSDFAAEDILPRARELGAKAYQDGTQVMQDASALFETVQEIGHEVGGTLGRNLRQRPYVVLGGAAAVGFVLGRGLTFGMSRTLFGMGGKFALGLVVRQITRSFSPFA